MLKYPSWFPMTKLQFGLDFYNKALGNRYFPEKYFILT